MTTSKPIRWWPAVTLIGIALAVLAWVRFGLDTHGQNRFLSTAATVVLLGICLLAWILFGSRMRWVVRLALALPIVAAGILASQLLEIHGVSGNLVPILGWRGAPGDTAMLDPTSRTATAAVPLEPQPGDYPQFLGPHRNGTVQGAGLADDWSSPAPRELWRRPVGAGWSGFAVAGDWAITQEQQGDEERVVAYDLHSGELRWVHADDARYETTIGGVGPRATPTIAGGRVYTMGATGLLNALDLASGHRLWSHDVVAENGGGNPEWGNSCSPLVAGGKVIVSGGAGAGRSLVAYDAESGALLWHGGDSRPSFSSPLLATLAGLPQIVIFNNRAVAGHDPDSGEVLWTHPWPSGCEHVAQPQPIGADTLLVSCGYGIGSRLLRIAGSHAAGFSAEQLWESRRLKAKFANYVLHEGRVYGLDDGVMVCLDPQTGERCWKRGRYGHGQLVLADNLLIVQTESGELVLVRPDPETLIELSTIEALTSKTWNSPALAGRYLLVRNDREAVCYELPKASS